MGRSALVLVTVSAALVLTGCAGPPPPGPVVADFSHPEQVFKRPLVDDAGELTLLRHGAFTDYNNGILAARSPQNEVVLSTVQPSPFFHDVVNGSVVIKLDGDLMETVEIASEEPLRVEWHIRDEAVWSDGVPVSCKDFHLRWLAATSGALVDAPDGTSSSAWDTERAGYDRISRHGCADGGRTVVAEFSTPYADYRGLYRFLLPAHVLEREAGIADITTLTDADAAGINRAADFYTTGWVGFDPSRALSAGPYRIESADESAVVLVRNERWWGPKAGPSKVTIRTENDAASAARQLREGAADVIAVDADPAIARDLAADPAPALAVGQGRSSLRIEFSTVPDKTVREAVAACVDRPALVAELVGAADPEAKPLGNLTILPSEVGYQDHYGDTGKGQASTARTILTAAGYAPGVDGVFARDGQRLSIGMPHRLRERETRVVQLVQQSCAAAGIEIVDQPDGCCATPSGLTMRLETRVGTALEGGAALDPQTSALVSAAAGQLDQEERVATLNRVDELMRAELHVLPLFAMPDLTVASVGLGPLASVADSGGVTWNLFAWQRR